MSISVLNSSLKCEQMEGKRMPNTNPVWLHVKKPKAC